MYIRDYLVIGNHGNNFPVEMDCLKLGFRGKIQGRNRSTDLFIYKFNNVTKPAFYEAHLTIDYSLSQADSLYGSFGIRV